jgi:hypothetical protein
MANNWPRQDFASMVAYYGNVGDNQTKLELPYPMRLAWDTTKTVKRITCHSKVRDSLGNVLAAIKDYYGNMDDLRIARMDLFGGCLNVRKMRGGDSWSIHSWGCAIDLDPDHNTLTMHRQQASMTVEIMALFEKEGWVSLGHSRDYDYMHFQAARL